MWLPPLMSTHARKTILQHMDTAADNLLAS